MDVTIPGVDYERWMDLHDGDEDRFLISLRYFVDNTPEDLVNLRDLSAETLGRYAVAARNIKETCKAIEAEEVRETALKLEILAVSGHLEMVQGENAAFIEQVDTLLADAKAWLNRKKN